MYNKTLADYIKEKLRAGYDINIIRSALYKWGYKLEDIDQTTVSLYPPKTQEQTKIKKEPDLLNLFFKPNIFFNNPNNTLKKSLKYFLYSFLILSLTQITITFLANIFKKEALANTFTLLLANVFAVLFFLLSVFIFFLVLILLCFFVFNYILKTEINFLLLLTPLFFSLLPYILINSLSNIPIYNIIVLFNISIGLFNINPFLIWSILLFSLGISKNLNISFKKSFFAVFIPFILLSVIIIIIFFSSVKLHILHLLFEKF